MHLVYEDTKEEILAVERKAKHQPPHLHQTMEIVYVMKGSLELGVGLELFHMEEGDIGLVFPDVIHHCQVFSEQYSEVLHINVPTRTLGRIIKKKSPGISGNQIWGTPFRNLSSYPEHERSRTEKYLDCPGLSAGYLCKMYPAAYTDREKPGRK